MLALKAPGSWSEIRAAVGQTVFARQWLPEARSFPVPSIRAAAETLVTELIGCLPEEPRGVCKLNLASESPMRAGTAVS